MRDSYFYRLYRHSKLLFVGILCFSLFTIFFNLTGDEVTPFFVWGMFSEVKQPQESYELYEIKLDGEHFDYTNKLIDFNRFYITGPLNMYRAMKAKGEAPTRAFFKEKMGNHYSYVAPVLEPITNDVSQLKDFPAWFKRYVEQSTNKSFQQIQVNLLSVRYAANGQVEIIDSKPFLTYEE